MSGGLRIRLRDRLYKALFPRRFAQRQREQEQELSQARSDKLAEEEYEVWVKGGKEAWRAWSLEQAQKRREEDRNRIAPAYLKELRESASIYREVRYPPLSPGQRKAKRYFHSFIRALHGKSQDEV